MQVLTKEQATTVERPAFPEPWHWPEVVQVGLSNTFDVIGMTLLKTPDGAPLEYALLVRAFETLYEAGYVVAKTDPKAAFDEGLRSGSVGNAVPHEFACAAIEREAFAAGSRCGDELLQSGELQDILLAGGIAAAEKRLREEFESWRKQEATVA